MNKYHKGDKVFYVEGENLFPVVVLSVRKGYYKLQDDGGLLIFSRWENTLKDR